MENENKCEVQFACLQSKHGTDKCKHFRPTPLQWKPGYFDYSKCVDSLTNCNECGDTYCGNLVARREVMVKTLTESSYTKKLYECRRYIEDLETGSIVENGNFYGYLMIIAESEEEAIELFMKEERGNKPLQILTHDIVNFKESKIISDNPCR